ncbi:MAG: response regulator [Ignavibacteria bacterium]|nr:response regulator [Ignavibacteria bacterium]
MKILVVDDEKDIEPLFNQKFRPELKNNKLRFEFAFSGEDAVKYLSEKNVSDIVLILSDINMPGMNGFELLEKIKDKFPQIKVFMITAYDDDEKQKKASKLGADMYLTKPINFENLKKEIFKNV